MKKILFGMIACAALCACSDDVVMETSSTPQIALDGNDVYLTVRLNDVGSATRATSTGYQYGSAAEYNINTAFFYFYDENGDFVSRAEVADFSTDVGGSATTDPSTGGNVEFQSNTVIVLRGLTDKKFPRYMVTVLNEPAGFEEAPYYEPAGTLDELQVKLANAADAIYDTDGETQNFVMSTSAYATPMYTGGYAEDETSDVSPWYFVTPIDEDNFSLEPIPAESSTPVQVYVERLAAKVGLSVSEDLAANFEEKNDEEGNSHDVYRLEESVAGAANDDDYQVQVGTDYTDYEVEGTDHVYVEFLGWALNGTARNSYISKDITRFVTDGEAQAVDGWTAGEWNVASDHRSYWGSSYNYGIEHEYPTSSVRAGQEVGNTDADELSDGTWLDEYLKYTSLYDGVESDGTEHSINALDTYEYCAENTNTVEILGDRLSSGITNALLKARIWVDSADGETITTDTIYRFEGMLFTSAAFREYIARRIGADTYMRYAHWSSNVNSDGSGTLLQPMDFEGNVYTLAELEEAGVDMDTWEDFSYDMLTFVEIGNGLVYVELNLDLLEFDMASDLFWIETGNVNEEGDTLYAIVANDEVQQDYENAETYLENILDSGYEINAYADGLMYYAIPIEHLNNTEPTTYGNEIVEAEYGIVRNHWYELSITGLTNLGKGIWNEEEVIIPDPTEPQYYYVEAALNVLSWKMVQQSVDL